MIHFIGKELNEMIQKIVYISSDKQLFSTSYAVKNYPSSMTENHYHSFYEILYLLKGERVFQIKDKTYILKPGNAVFVNPFDFHRSIDSDPPYYERILISFRKEFFNNMIDTSSINQLYCFDKNLDKISFSDEQRSYVEPVLIKLVNEFVDKKPGFELLLKSLMTEFLVVSSRVSAENISSASYEYPSDTHRRISEIVRYINSNYEQNINLSVLGNKFYFSSSYLSRTFKEIMVISLNSYIQHVRIRAAQDLLSNTDISITKICDKTGFNSINSLERTFKSITGKTPAGYRKISKNITGQKT